MEKIISVSKPTIGDDEKQAVQEVLDSGMVAQGSVVRELEERFAEYCGTNYAVALNSGTAALHTALHAKEVGPGDKVITTPFSFIATVNSILMQQAEPKFVDIEYGSFNIDTHSLEQAYEGNVKAVLPVDLYGQPADYAEINSFADAYGLAVIEDSCQSIGAEYLGHQTGTLGHIACFSLYATKNIMSAEGGVLTTNDEKVANEAKSFRQHGMDMSGQYEYTQLGYNYRTTDVLAAIALVQLAKADKLNNSRISNAKKLSEGLKDLPGLVIPEVKPGRTSVFHQYVVRINEDFPVSRDEFVARIKQKGILTAIFYPRPLHLYQHLSNLGYQEGDFPVAEQAAREVLALPVHPNLTDAQVEYIIESIKEIADV